MRDAAAQRRLAVQRFDRMPWENRIDAPVPDALVYFTWVDERGVPIQGARAQDFALRMDGTEEGAALRLTTFSQRKEPICLIAVVQLSPSGKGGSERLEQVRQGVSQLAETLRAYPGSCMGLLGYAADVKRLVEIGDGEAVKSALSALRAEPEATEPRLLDALREAIALLKFQGRRRRNLIILFSDGMDVNKDKRSFIEIGRRASVDGVVIDTIADTAVAGAGLRDLALLSKHSHGIARAAPDLAEIRARFAAVADEINQQYVATFRIQDDGGAEHEFQVVFDAGAGGRNSISSAIRSEALPFFGRPPPPWREPPSRSWVAWTLVASGSLTAVGVGLLRRRRRRRPGGDGMRISR